MLPNHQDPRRAPKLSAYIAKRFSKGLYSPEMFIPKGDHGAVLNSLD
jgi:hypothetical protein